MDGTADGLRRGDPAALERLVHEFHQPLYRFFHCSESKNLIAEELTAETFAQLLSGCHRFRGDDSQVRPFVYATARHVRSAHWRRKTRHELPLETAELVDINQIAPVDRIIATEQQENLLIAIGQLPDVVRDIVLLRYVNELSLLEISQAASLPVGTVKSHLHRGKQRLKELMVRIGENDDKPSLE